MRRACLYLLSIAMTVLLIGAALLWWRSASALDRIEGQLRFTRFGVESYSGRLVFQMSEPREARYDWVGPGVPAEADLVETQRKYRSDHASRYRWPLAQTTLGQQSLSMWPMPAVEREVVGHYYDRRRFDRVTSVTVPYWLLILVSGVMPTLAIVSIVRRRRRIALGPTACRVCGYDCRASPDRCPECGTPRDDPNPEADDGRGTSATIDDEAARRTL